MTAEILGSTAFIVSSATFVISSLARFAFHGFDEIKKVRSNKKRQRHPHAQLYRQRPLVSILIHAKDNVDDMDECLSSIVMSSYRNYEVVVIDNKSSDGTALYTREFIGSHPKQRLKLLKKKQRVKKSMAIYSGLSRYAKGELILILDPGQRLSRGTIRQVVDNFNQFDPSLLRLKFEIKTKMSIVHLLNLYTAITPSMSDKYSPLTPGVVSRRSTLLAHLNKATRTNSPRWPMWTIPLAGRVLVSLLRPSAFIYCLYLAIDLSDPRLFIISWMLFGFGFSLNLSSEPGLTNRQRYTYLAMLPAIYSLSIISDTVLVVRDLLYRSTLAENR